MFHDGYFHPYLFHPLSYWKLKATKIWNDGWLAPLYRYKELICSSCAHIADCYLLAGNYIDLYWTQLELCQKGLNKTAMIEHLFKLRFQISNLAYLFQVFFISFL